MTGAPIDEVVRDNLQALAATLPVEIERGWRETTKRRLSATPESRLHAPDRTGLRASRRTLVLAVAAVAVAVAASVASLSIGTHTASSTPALPEPLPFAHGGHARAVGILERAAALQQQLVGADGPVRYAKTQSYALQTDVAHRTARTTVETTIREVWVGADGSVLAKSSLQDTTRAGAPVGPPSPPSRDPHWQDTNAALPASPAAIAAALVPQGEPSSLRELIEAQAILAHLAPGTTTPAQTAALYRLLARLPGVFEAGTVTDNAGRSGQAVGILTGHFDAGSRCIPVSGDPALIEATLAANHVLGDGITYLVLDPATGRPLQVEQVDTPNAPCGLRLPAGPTIEQYSIILNSGTVPTSGAEPR